MGHLKYANNAAPIEMADEMLAHLRAVTMTKLRRGESFALTLPTEGHAFETLWIHASIPIQFALDANIQLQRPLLTSMMEAASSSSGLDLVDDRLAAGSKPARQLHAMSA